jgi:carboxypeptidase C (cathepsin A)
MPEWLDEFHDFYAPGMVRRMPEEAKPVEEAKKSFTFSEEAPAITKHEVTVGGKKLSYTATVGRMPFKTEKDEIEAQMFYMAYTLDGAKPGSRPLMFSFNGGPGSPSLWLHLGALGPKRIFMTEDGQFPPPPHKLVDNEFTWLEHTDLVFIDPIKTGFSRALSKEVEDKHLGVQGDIESVSEFIRLYLSRNERWNSPLYLVGESYGTLRSAGIAGNLIDKGIAFNGIILVSSILNYQTARFVKGNDLPYVLFLPTYAATSHYHGKVAKRKNLRAFLREVEKYAIGPYASLLAQGDAIPNAQRRNAIQTLSKYTGLSPAFIENSNLRINIHAYCKELLRDRKRTVGRIDSRFVGIDGDQTAQLPEHDPSISALMPPYVSTFNQYVREELGYKSDLEYLVFGKLYEAWNWGSAGQGMPDTSEALRKAVSKNPHMRIYIASGYYDLATPFFATEYTLNHMSLDASVRGNFETGEYEAGHMMYIHAPSLEKIKADVGRFVG